MSQKKPSSKKKSSPRKRKKTVLKFPPVMGLNAEGVRAPIAQPYWREHYGFWGSFELCAQMAAAGFQVQDQAATSHLFEWRADAEPGSTQEYRQLIGAQMWVSQTTLRHLASAEVIICNPDDFDAVEQFADHAQAQAWGASVQLPWPAMYLDLCPPDRDHFAAMAVEPDGKPWAFGGALVFREHEHSPLSVVIFASPGGDEGPLFQPLAHILLGEDSLPSPAPGEVVINAASGQSVTPLVSDPESRLAVRISGALTLLTGALSILRHTMSPDVELLPELRNPTARRAMLQDGRRIALTPRPRSVPKTTDDKAVGAAYADPSSTSEEPPSPA